MPNGKNDYYHHRLLYLYQPLSHRSQKVLYHLQDIQDGTETSTLLPLLQEQGMNIHG